MHRNMQLSSAPYVRYFINQVFSRQNREVVLLPLTQEMHHDTSQIMGLKHNNKHNVQRS